MRWETVGREPGEIVLLRMDVHGWGRGFGLSAQEYGEFGFFSEMTSGLCFRFQHNARLNSWHLYVRSNGVAWLSCSFGRERAC